MSKTVVPTPLQKVVIADESQELLQKVVLSEMTMDENTIMGNVSDKLTGKPIEGVCIKICDNEYKPITYNFTDVDGNFTVQSRFPPIIRIIAGKKGYETFSSEGLPSINLEKKAVNMELMPAPNGGIVFFGSVRDTQQKPIGGVKVTVYRSHSLNPYDFSFTNEEGLFVFDNVEPGNYRIAVQAQNYSEKILNMEVSNEQSIVTLEPIFLRRKQLKGTIHGIITDKNGSPVENALVVLCNGNNIPIQVTYTNEKGVYLFYRLDPGSYAIMAK